MCESIRRILHIFQKKQKKYMIYFVILHKKNHKTGRRMTIIVNFFVDLVGLFFVKFAALI